MSTEELHAILDEVDHRRDVFSTQAQNKIQQSCGHNHHSHSGHSHDDGIDSNIVTADQLIDDEPLATPQAAMLRYGARKTILQQRQQQRRETHQELIRYPGWNYYIHLNSESILLLITIIMTSFRFVSPMILDFWSVILVISNFIFGFEPPSTANSGIHDPYRDTNPIIESTNYSLTFYTFTFRSIMPIIATFLSIIIFTILPKLGRYTRAHESFNLGTSMPYPPPYIYLTHALIILFGVLVIDFFGVCGFEYHILYQLFQKLPENSPSIYEFLPLIIQGVLIMYYFILVLIQLCLVLLMLTECHCIYQSQKWWANYTDTFQTKKRCFLVGNYNQINNSHIKIKNIPSILMMYTKLYFNFYKIFFIYYFKKIILQNQDLMIPMIFPYPISDRGQFKRQIYKRFPFLEGKPPTINGVSGNGVAGGAPSPTPTSHSTSRNKIDRFGDDDDMKNDHNNDNSSDNEDEQIFNSKTDEGTALLGSTSIGTNSQSDPTLVLPCAVLPPYIFPIQQPILKFCWETFVLELITWIREYRESVSSITSQPLPEGYSRDDGNNGPALGPTEINVATSVTNPTTTTNGTSPSTSLIAAPNTSPKHRVD